MPRAILPQQSQLLPRPSQSVSTAFVGRSGAALRSRAVRKETRASVGAAQLRADSCGWLAIEDEFGEVYYFHGRTVRTHSSLFLSALPIQESGLWEQERRTRAEPAAFRDLRAAQLAAQSRQDANLQSLLSAVQITPPDGPSARTPLSRRAKPEKDSPPGTPPSERQSGLDTVSYHG